MSRFRFQPASFALGSLLLHGVVGGGGALLAHHAAAARQQAPKDATPAALTGDSFDISAVDEPARVLPRDEVNADPATTNGLAARPQPSHPARAARPGAPTAGAELETPPTYGALGDRSAVDVAVAVSRGFPQAASTDPVWATTPLGTAGEATMEIEIDANGNLLRWSLDAGATPALRQAMVRTMALVGGRSFVSHGAVTRLRVSARVSTDAVRDGADSVYALHSEHEGRDASAYFSLSIGRRIDVVLHELR